MKAIEFEAARQVEVIESGGKVEQETRLFDSDHGQTRAMRSKEEAHDYRYFPDPDLLPLDLEREWVDDLKKNLPELPDDLKRRFVEQYGITSYDAGVLVGEKESAQFFEEVANGRDGKLVANWIMGEFFGALNKSGLSVLDSPISSDQLGGLIDRLADGTLSGRLAKEVFEIMFKDGGDADQIIEEKGLKQVTDSKAIDALIDEVIFTHPDKVAEYRGGKDKLMGWFVGQVMKASNGKANPGTVNTALLNKLNKD